MTRTQLCNDGYKYKRIKQLDKRRGAIFLSNFLLNNKDEKKWDFTFLFVFRLSQNIFFFNKIGIDFIFLINFFIGNYFTSLEGDK